METYQYLMFVSITFVSCYVAVLAFRFIIKLFEFNRKITVPAPPKTKEVYDITIDFIDGTTEDLHWADHIFFGDDFLRCRVGRAFFTYKIQLIKQVKYISREVEISVYCR